MAADRASRRGRPAVNKFARLLAVPVRRLDSPRDFGQQAREVEEVAGDLRRLDKRSASVTVRWDVSVLEPALPETPAPDPRDRKAQSAISNFSACAEVLNEFAESTENEWAAVLDPPGIARAEMPVLVEHTNRDALTSTRQGVE